MKRKRIPKPINTNNMQLAVMGASTLDPQHQVNIRAIIQRAWEALLAGESTSQALADLAYSANMAMELSHMGICSDANSRDKIETSQTIIAKLARQEIIADSEISTMEEAIFLYGVQLRFCSMKEFEQARQNVNKALADARRGVVGKHSTVIQLGG